MHKETIEKHEFSFKSTQKRITKKATENNVLNLNNENNIKINGI